MPDPLQRLRGSYQQSWSTDSTSGPSPSGSSSVVGDAPSYAPTPYNTYIDTQIYSTASEDAFEHLDEPLRSDDPPIPFESSERPHLSSVPSDTSSTSYHNTSSLRSGSHLLRLSSSESTSIPVSMRPVPAPPQVRHPNDGAMSPSHFSFSDHRGSGTTSPNGKSVTVHEVTVGHAPVLKQEEVDALRLQQLGYDQVLGRDYTFCSSLAISTINIGCLQGVVFGVYGAYRYGGPMMLLVAWPISGLFGIALTLALAEQASAYPVSGAMASWAWKLSRGSIGGERGWGWLMGGVVLGGHIGNALLVTLQNVTIIQGVMEMAFDYQPHGWHAVCFFLAIIFLCGFVGSTGWGRSHRFWLTCGAYAICVYLILNISLITTVAKNPNIRISTNFSNATGWSSKAYVYILGWQFTCVACGADASAHMAEETQKPSRNVPNAMVCSMIISYVFGYITMILIYLAVRSDDLTAIAAHDFPFGHILEYTINRPGAIAICCLIIVLLVMQIHAQLQASSRFVFHLARDNAMPLSDVIRRTNSRKQPTVASWAVAGLCIPFCWLTITRKGTLYSVLAVTGGSLSYAAYLIPVILYLWSGKDLQTEGRTSWSLRRFSKPVAMIGILYGFAVIITQMFPSTTPVTAQNISWSPVVLVGTGLMCLLTWFLYGNKHYSGPIRALTKWETGVEIDLQSALASQRSKPTNNSDGNDLLTPKNVFSTLEDQRGSTRVMVESADESVWTDATASEIDTRLTERSRHTHSVTFDRISEEQNTR